MAHARSQYNVFGTSSALKTLTASFVADAAQNSIINFDGYREVVINLSFLTGSGTGEFSQVQIETSNDITNGTPTNWFVFGETASPDASPATTLSVPATPYKFPGEVLIPVAATSYKTSYPIKIQARWLRFKLKSTASSNFGSAWLQVWCSEV